MVAYARAGHPAPSPGIPGKICLASKQHGKQAELASNQATNERIERNELEGKLSGESIGNSLQLNSTKPVEIRMLGSSNILRTY